MPDTKKTIRQNIHENEVAYSGTVTAVDRQDHRSPYPLFAEAANLNKPLLKQTATQESLKKLSAWTMDTFGITRMLYE